MTLGNTGGGITASPITKAVIDSLGKRYLVEHQEEHLENGTAWYYDKYSDGFVIQYGFAIKGGGRTTITLPVSMRDTSYFVFITNSDVDGNDTDGWGGTNGCNLAQRSTTSIIYSSYGDCSWYVAGYSA